MIESWFPRNHKIADGVVLKSVLFTGDNWQICLSAKETSVLVAKEKIAQFWTSAGLLDATVLYPFQFGAEKFYALQSPTNMMLVPISYSQEFLTYEDGKSFALALAATRKIVPNISLSKGIFVERYSRILPDESDPPYESDEILLGRWLSRGTDTSAGSVQRMLQLFPTVTEKGLLDILETAHITPCVEEVQGDKNLDSAQKGSSALPKQPFSLAGRNELEAFFKDYIIDIVQNPEDYKNMGIDFPSAFILQGPPGCGKTYAVEKLVDYLDWPCFYIEASSIGSPYIHETSKKISALFDEAMQKAPSVLVIDEMESFLSDRKDCGTAGGHHVEEMAEFLRKISEATKKHVLVVAMTNMISSIDSAIRRKGRFDHIIEVGMPSKQEILAVLQNGLDKVPHDKDINLEKISEALADRPMSDVAFAMREAARITAKNHKKTITQAAFDTVLVSMAGSSKAEHRPIGFGNSEGEKK